MVNLYKVCFAFGIEHNVEPKDFKAHVVVDVARLAGSIRVEEVRLYRYQGFDYNLFNLALDFLYI
jgi:hypothetical protein